MPRRRLSLTARAALLALAAGALAFAVPAGGAPPDPLAAVAGATSFVPGTESSVPSAAADPFPIRRTFLTGDRLTAALADAARGALARLPREEFEAKVRAAAAHAAAPPPRLAEARYRAALTDGGLTGTAEWHVAGSGLLPLDPLRPAVSDPRWADGSPAAVVRVEPPGRPAGAYLLLDRPGDGAVSLNWSARGAEEPGAERFDLALPPAPVATLELDLPADRVPAVASPDQLLTGPLAGPSADRRVWRVAFGGQSRVDLAVRRPHRPGEPGPAVRVHRSARYDLSLGVAACSVEFDLEAVRGQPEDLTFEADAGLRITDVTGPGRLGWRAEPGEPTRVVVAGRDPAAAGRVTVTGFAAVPASGEWRCPQVRLVGGLPGRDEVEVRIDPEVKFAGLDPGDYRVTAAGTAERGYRVSLSGGLTPPGGERTDRRPPVVRVRDAGAEYSSTEEVSWRVAAGRTDVAARFRVRVSRGPLVRIPIRLSPGLTVESVRLVPDDPGVPAAPQPGPDGVVQIEPTRPVSSGQAVEVRVELRGPAAPPAADPADAGRGRAGLRFPVVTVDGAAEREGLFTLSASPAFRAWPVPAPPHDPAAGEGSAAYAYPFRGRPPDGRVVLAPRPPQVSVGRDTAVSLEGGELTAAATLTVRCEDGEFGSLTLFTPGGPDVRWEVRADGAEVRQVPGGELLPWAGVLAAAAPWPAAAGVVAAAPGGVWRVEYPRPVGGEAVVTAVVRRPVPGDGGPAEVPLPVVLGAAHAPAAVTLAPSAAALYEPAGPPTAGAVALRPRGAAAPPAAGAGWAFDRVELVTRVGSDGGLACTFTGVVTDAADSGLAVGLPDGAELTAALVAGRYVERPEVVGGDGAGGWRVVLPLPAAGPDGTSFEVRYRLPGSANAAGVLRPVARFASPVPILPADPGGVAVRWAVAPEYRRWPALDAPAVPAGGGVVLTAVSAAAVTAVGYAAAAVLLGVGAVLVTRGSVRRRQLVALAGGVAVLGAAAYFLPEGWLDLIRPPLAAALLTVAAVALFAARAVDAPAAGPGGKPQLPSTVSHARVAAVVFAAAAIPAIAQAPEPATVYVVPGPPSAPDRLAVLAPRAVLDRLDALAGSPVPAAVITAAEYDGSAASADAPASFTAAYDVLCTRDGGHALTLPLTGVRLEGMDLDGKPAYPDGSRPDGYTVTVRGAGRHRLTARFAVPPAAVGADREVRFGVPDVPCCRVRFTGPAGSTQLDVATRRGAEASSRDGDRPRADADHGGGRAIAVRWRDGAAGGARTTLAVREACVWDLSESGESVTAAFQYRIDGGSATRLQVEFPDGLEPGRVVVRSADGRAGPGLRDWQLGDGPDGWRTLTLGLQAPAEGRLIVVVRFHPRRPLSVRPTLRFPRAAGVEQADSFYAVRTYGVAVHDAERVGVIDYPAEAVAKEFAPVTELGLDRAAPDRVFMRVAPAAEVRPTLRTPGEPAGGSAEAAWTIGPRADAEGMVRGGQAATSLVEFDLPESVRLDEVRHPDLWAWDRTGSRVQVWLRKRTADAVVRWSGSLTGYPPEGGPPDPATLDLPLPRPVGGGPVAVRVRAAEGWAVVPQQTRGLKPLAQWPGGGMDYTAEPDAPAPRFQVFAPRPPLAADLLETAERAGDAIRYRAVVRVSLEAGRPHHFALRLAGLPSGAETGVQAPEGAAVVRSGGGWAVSVPPPAGGPLTFTLSAALPLPARLPRPAVSFGGRSVEWSGRTLTLGPGLVPGDGPSGWRPAGADRTWVADGGAGRWMVEAAAPPRRQDAGPVAGGPAAAVPPADPEPSAAIWWSPVAWSAAAAVAWVAGLALVLALAGWGGRGWWPEVLVGCGLLGLAVVGADDLPAVALGAVAAAGVAGRAGWVARRVAGVVMR
jgi:hypothetical protein